MPSPEPELNYRDDLVDREAQPSGKASLGCLSPKIADLIGKFENLDPIRAPTVEPSSIAPFCACGDMMMPAALSGTGKTTIATELLLGGAHPGRNGLALGGLFRFHHGDNDRTNCAVIDAESTRVRWESVLARKARLEGLDPRELSVIRYLRAADFGLHSVAQREANSRDLAEALAHDRRKVVIIDTAAAVWSPPNLNDPEWVFTGLKPFRETCQKYGITVVCFAHTSRKAGNEGQSFSPIGSSHQENQADVALAISRAKKHGYAGITIVHRKSRRSFWIARDSSVFLRFTTEYGFAPTGNWAETWAHDWSPAQEDDSPRDQPLRMQIQHVLRDAAPEPLSTKEIASATGAPERTVRQHLSALTTDCIAQTEGRGPRTRYRYVQ